MKYNNFDDWFKRTKYYHYGAGMREPLLDAWDAAGQDTTKADIIEMQKVVEAAMKINCTCDQKQIGYRCGCGRAKAVQEAVIDLSKYLRGLK